MKEVKKIARLLKYPSPNLPTPAVLVVCCLIDTLSKSYIGKTPCDRFSRYIKQNMKATFQQLAHNDCQKSQQIKNLNCSFKGHSKAKCKTSAEILYRHVRCGLVHDYFALEGCVIINRLSRKQENVIVDQSKKYDKYALVLNGPPFVKDFLTTL